MIYISHVLGDVLRLCDDVVVLRDGEVVGPRVPRRASTSRPPDLADGGPQPGPALSRRPGSVAGPARSLLEARGRRQPGIVATSPSGSRRRGARPRRPDGRRAAPNWRASSSASTPASAARCCCAARRSTDARPAARIRAGAGVPHRGPPRGRPVPGGVDRGQHRARVAARGTRAGPLRLLDRRAAPAVAAIREAVRLTPRRARRAARSRP